MQGETARVTFATRLHSGPPIFADRNTIGNHMNKGQKNTVVRIAASALLLGTAWLPLLSPALHIALCAAAYLVIGADILFRAVRNILHGKIFDENFLMSVATVGAFAIGEYPEAVAVMLFYQTGELFQDMAVVRSRKSIAALMDIRPDYANLEDARGELHRVAPDDVPAGSIIVTKPGEKIPLDGVIVAGSSALDTAALTGESLPKEVTEHDIVLSGSLNMTGLLRIRTTGVYGESTVARILDLVENADTGKAATEKFITRFARYYTPAVVIAALLPLFFNKGIRIQPKEAHERAKKADVIYFFARRSIWKQIGFLFLYYSGLIGTLAMLKPWLVDLGYDMKEIGVMSGVAGTFVGFLSSFAGGMIVRRIGRFRARILFAVFVLMATLYFLGLSYVHPTTPMLYGGIFLLWGSYGMATIVVYTTAMDCVRPGREGTDFTIQTVITHLSGMLMAILSGRIADHTGYHGLFFFEASIALVSLIYIVTVFRKDKNTI